MLRMLAALSSATAALAASRRTAALAADGSRAVASAAANHAWGAARPRGSASTAVGLHFVPVPAGFLVAAAAAEALEAPAARRTRWRSLATAERRAWSSRFASSSSRSRRCISPESSRCCIHAPSLMLKSWMASAFRAAAGESALGGGAAGASVRVRPFRLSVAARFASVALRYAGSAQLARCTAERGLSDSLFRSGSSSYSSNSSYSSKSGRLSCSSRRVRLVLMTSSFSTKKPVSVRRLA
mmetsp:Transcript_50842/g.122193  ORF Transcript_50842/g.122193 Transcript_50842/m.122193 type:complete len:242 (-) Transcript_50842:143-868(-)